MVVSGVCENSRGWRKTRYFAVEGDFLVGGTHYFALRELLGEHSREIVSGAKRTEASVASLQGCRHLAGPPTIRDDY
jgi:hypothetical protein